MQTLAPQRTETNLTDPHADAVMRLFFGLSHPSGREEWEALGIPLAAGPLRLTPTEADVAGFLERGGDLDTAPALIQRAFVAERPGRYTLAEALAWRWDRVDAATVEDASRAAVHAFVRDRFDGVLMLALRWAYLSVRAGGIDRVPAVLDELARVLTVARRVGLEVNP